MRELVGISRAYGRVSILSFLLLLWSSSGVFLPIERALNRAWEVEKQRSWWRRRLLALEMAGIFGFLAMFSTLLVGTRRYTHAWLRTWVASSVLPLVEFSYHALFVAATFGITLCMFLVLFERLPNRPMAFRQAFPGALLTALLLGSGARAVYSSPSFSQLPPALWLDRGGRGPDDLGLHFLGRHAFWRPGVPLALSNMESQGARRRGSG